MHTPMIGVSLAIQKIRDLIDRLSKAGQNIVICGESGVGKELIARDLYLKSDRNGKPFIKINCAALPEKLLEKELFGCEQGAFADADHKKRGRFELALNGVLMLDEIGEMSLPLQSKMLNVLQSGEFSPMGSEKEIKTSAWIIAATNQDLEQNIKDMKFGEDLTYRLNVPWVYVPPLRDRAEDILPLVDYYLGQYSDRFHLDFQMTPDDRRRMESYSWPGNIPEIQNALKRMMDLGSCGEILDQLEYSR